MIRDTLWTCDALIREVFLEAAATVFTLDCFCGRHHPQTQVIAYVFVKDTIINPSDIAAARLTRINYAFANIEDGKIIEGFQHDAQNFAVLQKLKTPQSCSPDPRISRGLDLVRSLFRDGAYD